MVSLFTTSQARKIFMGFIVVLVMIPMQLSIIGFYQYMSDWG